MVLIADESDDNPLAIYSAVCLTCSAAQTKDQILTDWAQELVELYGTTDFLIRTVPGEPDQCPDDRGCRAAGRAKHRSG
jgi:hypothetical protein